MFDAASDDRWGTQAEVGKAAGISQQSVSNWIKRGVVKPRKDGKLHIGRSVAAIAAARDPERALIGDVANGKAIEGADNSKAAATASPSALLKARTVSATLAAKQQEIKLAQMRGELIDKKQAKMACLAVVSEIRARLEGLPGQAAAAVHGATNVAEAEAILRGLVRAVMVEVAKLGDPIA